MYVNGRPYVLREAARPFKNLLEYHGILAERLERMEARLRVRAGWHGPPPPPLLLHRCCMRELSAYTAAEA